MTKLLNQYKITPTLKLAQQIRAYDRKHPMASCMLNTILYDLKADAIHHANKG